MVVVGDVVAMEMVITSTLMGLAISKKLTKADNYSLTYYAPQPRATLRIVNPDKPEDVVPYNEYEVLKDTYQEWVDEPKIDPFPLPVEYVGDAEPEQI